jgi:hypothetical protein
MFQPEFVKILETSGSLEDLIKRGAVTKGRFAQLFTVGKENLSPSIAEEFEEGNVIQSETKPGRIALCVKDSNGKTIREVMRLAILNLNQLAGQSYLYDTYDKLFTKDGIVFVIGSNEFASKREKSAFCAMFREIFGFTTVIKRFIDADGKDIDMGIEEEGDEDKIVDLDMIDVIPVDITLIITDEK